jgi:hypothetical protein
MRIAFSARAHKRRRAAQWSDHETTPQRRQITAAPIAFPD